MINDSSIIKWIIFNTHYNDDDYDVAMIKGMLLLSLKVRHYE